MSDFTRYPAFNRIMQCDATDAAGISKTDSMLAIPAGEPAAALPFASFGPTKRAYAAYLHARYILCRLLTVSPELPLDASHPLLRAYNASFARCIHLTAALSRLAPALEPAANNCLLEELERFLAAYAALSSCILAKDFPARTAVPTAIHALLPAARASTALTGPALSVAAISAMADTVLAALVSHLPTEYSPVSYCLVILPAALLVRAINTLSMAVPATTRSSLPAHAEQVYAAIEALSPPCACDCPERPTPKQSSRKRKAGDQPKSAELVGSDDDASAPSPPTPVQGPISLDAPFVPLDDANPLFAFTPDLGATDIDPAELDTPSRKSRKPRKPKEPVRCPGCDKSFIQCRKDTVSDPDYRAYIAEIGSHAVRNAPMSPELLARRTAFLKRILPHPGIFAIVPSDFLTLEDSMCLHICAFYWPSIFPGTDCPYADVAAYVNANPHLFVKAAKQCPGVKEITLHPHDIARGYIDMLPLPGYECRRKGQTEPDFAPAAPTTLAAVVSAIDCAANRTQASLDSLALKVDSATASIGRLGSSVGAAMQLMIDQVNSADKASAQRSLTIAEMIAGISNPLAAIAAPPS